jgi:hypothetical protein
MINEHPKAQSFLVSKESFAIYIGVHQPFRITHALPPTGDLTGRQTQQTQQTSKG